MEEFRKPSFDRGFRPWYRNVHRNRVAALLNGVLEYEVRAAFADVPPDKLQKMIDRAVSQVRKEMRQERQSRTER